MRRGEPPAGPTRNNLPGARPYRWRDPARTGRPLTAVTGDAGPDQAVPIPAPRQEIPAVPQRCPDCAYLIGGRNHENACGES